MAKTDPLTPIQDVATPGEYLSPAQAARELGVTSKRVHQLLESGKLSGTRTVLGRVVTAASVAALRAERAT